MLTKLGLLILLSVAGVAATPTYIAVALPDASTFPAQKIKDSQGNIYQIVGLTIVKTTPTGAATVLVSAKTSPLSDIGANGVPYVRQIPDFTFTDLTVDSSDNVYAVEGRNVGANYSSTSDETIISISPQNVVTANDLGSYRLYRGSIPIPLITSDAAGDIFYAEPDGSIVMSGPSGGYVFANPPDVITPEGDITFPTALGADADGDFFIISPWLRAAGRLYAGAPIEYVRLTSVPKFAIAPQGGNTLYGTSLSVAAFATLPISYQWFRDGKAVAGATAPTLSATVSGVYMVVASTADGSTLSTAVSVAVVDSNGAPVLATPTILTSPTSATIIYGTTVNLTVTAVAAQSITYQWLIGGTTIPGATSSSYTASLPGVYTVSVSTLAGSVTSAPATVTTTTPGGLPVAAAPTIVNPPSSTVLNLGGSVPLTVSAVASLPIRYQWQRNGADIAGATSAAFTATSPGVYSVKVSTDAGTISTQSVNVTLANWIPDLSARVFVGSGETVGIGGFVIAGDAGTSKRILIRGVGPSLATLGITGFLGNPILSIFDSAGNLLAKNSGWGDSATVAAAASSVGDFALLPGSNDAALVLSLAPGAYTAQVAGSGVSTGLALIEVYELANNDGHLAGISTRAFVGNNSNVLIGGFVVSGTSSAQILVRGIGPSLKNFGVAGALEQTALGVYNASGQLIAANAGWANSVDAAKIAAASAATGEFPLQPGIADSAVILTLSPGAYTAQVTGANNATGVGLVEVYQVPQTP